MKFINRKQVNRFCSLEKCDKKKLIELAFINNKKQQLFTTNYILFQLDLLCKI